MLAHVFHDSFGEKPHEQQRSLKGPVFHRIGHLKKSQKSKRRDLSILVWTWRSKKRKRTAPMRSWTSTVAVMQKNRAQPRSASPQSASSSEMGNDRWLHHMSQIEPLFFFWATTFSVAVLLGGGGVEAAMFAANHSRGHEDGGEVSAWRECLESEERPVFACAIRFHERRGARTSSELCILLRSVPSCRPRFPCHLEEGGTNEALARLWPGPRVSRQEQADVTARPWCVGASQGHVRSRLERVGPAPRRVAPRCALFFSPAIEKSTAFKEKRPWRMSTFFFFFHPYFFSPTLAFFSYQGNVTWVRVVGVGQ